MKEIRQRLINTLKMENYSFRGNWFRSNGVSTDDGNSLLWSLKNEGIIDFDMFLGGIDYGSVELN